MGIPIRKVLEGMPAARKKKIKATADGYIREYHSLAALRKELGITQAEMARHQGVRQVAISNLERRNDMLLSTLHRYVEALGGELEITIRIPETGTIRISQLGE